MATTWGLKILEPVLDEIRHFPLGLILEGNPASFVPFLEALKTKKHYRINIFPSTETVTEAWKKVLEGHKHTIYPEGSRIMPEIVDNSKADFALIALDPSAEDANWYVEFHSMFCLELTLFLWETSFEGHFKEGLFEA